MQYPYIFMSAFNKNDIDQLKIKIESILKEHWDQFIIELNPTEGNTLYRLKNETIIVDKKYDENKNKYIIQGFMRKEHPLKYLIKE